jgi:hypothetical protein
MQEIDTNKVWRNMVHICRWLLIIVICYYVYKETGVATAAGMLVLFVGVEANWIRAGLLLQKADLNYTKSVDALGEKIGELINKVQDDK